MKIRVADSNDVSSICMLYDEFYAYNATLQPGYYNSAKEDGAYPLSVIKSDGSRIFVSVDEDDKIAGFVHVEKGKTPPYPSVATHEYIMVVDLIVSENFRQRGVGSMLMNEAKIWGKSLGLDYIELSVLSNAEIKLRVVKFKLPSDEIEMLITNLWKKILKLKTSKSFISLDGPLKSSTMKSKINLKLKISPEIPRKPYVKTFSPQCIFLMLPPLGGKHKQKPIKSAKARITNIITQSMLIMKLAS